MKKLLALLLTLVLLATALISFVSALVSMLSLETAIISKLSNTLNSDIQKLITGLSAFAVLSIIAYIGIFMTVKGNKAIKSLKNK